MSIKEARKMGSVRRASGRTGRVVFSAWLVVALIAGCAAKTDDVDADQPDGTAGNGGGAGVGASGDGAGESGESGSQAVAGDNGGGSGNGGGSAGTGAGSGSAGTDATAGSGGNREPVEVPEELDPNVDWTALTIVYPSMYSAYDGEHTFQVPAYVDGLTVELSDWLALPSSAVTFEEDPEGEGVLITVVEPVETIKIAVRTDDIGGVADLHVTIGTPDQWAMGEARYNNGVEYDLNLMIDFAMLLDPNWQPPEPPDDLACNNCHTTGAKYFEVQHTPTQAARFSDEDLINIFENGTKPDGVGYRILPEMFQDLYEPFHTWMATPEEQQGLIIYMRSLTPTGQGDLLLPDGTYVPIDMLPMFPMMP